MQTTPLSGLRLGCCCWECWYATSHMIWLCQKHQIGFLLHLHMYVVQHLMNIQTFLNPLSVSYSMILQIRRGRKPDGVCLVVGTCARGFENNSNSDVIFSSSTVKRVGDSKAQYFWEVTFYYINWTIISSILILQNFTEIFTGISSRIRSSWPYYLYVHLCRTSTRITKIGRIVGRILESDARISGIHFFSICCSSKPN